MKELKVKEWTQQRFSLPPLANPNLPSTWSCDVLIFSQRKTKPLCYNPFCKWLLSLVDVFGAEELPKTRRLTGYLEHPFHDANRLKWVFLFLHKVQDPEKTPNHHRVKNTRSIHVANIISSTHKIPNFTAGCVSWFQFDPTITILWGIIKPSKWFEENKSWQFP